MGMIFMPTGRCVNDCLICCDKSNPSSSYYHVGQNEEEMRGLENFLEGCVDLEMTISGGDPLMNLDFLELFLKVHKGDRALVMNPLSFFYLETGKPVSRMRISQLKEVRKNVKKNGFSGEAKRALELIKKFDYIDISAGNLQSPTKSVRDEVYELYCESLYDEIKHANPEIRAVSYFDEASCAYSFGEDKKLTDHIAQGIGRKAKGHKCIPRNDILCFKLFEGKPYLYFDGCCAAMATRYISHKCSLTIYDMADMDSSKIKEVLDKDCKEMKKTAWFSLLNDCNISAIRLSLLEKNFAQYISFAEDILWERAEELIDIDFLTRTFRNIARPCEACNTVSALLYENGIEPEEWHAYLEEHYEV